VESSKWVSRAEMLDSLQNRRWTFPFVASQEA
jgi:hypothetical protein